MLRKDLLNVLLAVNKILMLVATICEAHEDSVYKYHCVILASMSEVDFVSAAILIQIGLWGRDTKIVHLCLGRTFF